VHLFDIFVFVFLILNNIFCKKRQLAGVRRMAQTTHGLYNLMQNKEMMMRSSSCGSNLLLRPACPIYPFKPGEESSPFKMK
jgi:hypothetical protein